MEKKFANRLLKLADFLDALPRKKFDYSTYGEERACGTVACALGWAPSLPFAKKEKASRVLDNDYFYDFAICGQYAGPHEVSKHLFDLNPDEHRSLFVPGPIVEGYSGLWENATPKQVAKHIRKFVKEKTAP